MNYSKNSYDTAIARSHENNSQPYIDGFSYEGENDLEEFNKKYTVTKEIGCPVWGDFYTGYSDKQEILAYEKFLRLELNSFSYELTTLLKKYNVSMSFGCGCCGGGMQCEDVEFWLTNVERNCLGGEDE